MRLGFPSDLTDEQWDLEESTLGGDGKWDRPMEMDPREVGLDYRPPAP